MRLCAGQRLFASQIAHGIPLILILALALGGFQAPAADPAPGTSASFAFDHTHSALTRLLATHVQDASVDYRRLREAPALLDDYLTSLAAVSESVFRGWTAPERMAFLINLYNASTLRLVRDHYPVTSIRKIGGLFSTPWKLPCVQALGRTLSLDELEHDILRPAYPDSRLHFALVCAARGCPPLRPEAYRASDLDAQLDDQGRQFFASPTKNRYAPESHTLWLSPIFEWYAKDFTRGGTSLVAVAQKYLPGTNALPVSASATGAVAIRYSPYDWSLNDQIAIPVPIAAPVSSVPLPQTR